MSVDGRSRGAVLAAAAFLLVFSSFVCSAVAAAEHKRIMLLHSFGQDFKPWSEYGKAIRVELSRQSPWPLDIIDHSLISARSSDENPEGPFVEYLQALFAKQPLDLIIGIGAPASAFVQRNRQRLFTATPMVFTAVEQRRVQHSSLTENDAVVPVWINYRAAFENILHVLPETKTVTVVVGASPIEKFWKEAIGKEVEPLASRVSVAWTDHLSFEEFLKHAATLPPHSALFWELMIVDAAGVVHRGDEPIRRLHAVANAPLFSYDESFFGGEIVGGPLLPVADTSRQTAAVAVRILGGERAGDIKTPPIQFAMPMFDWRQLQRWAISESRLPPGSQIYFRDPTAWEQYRLQVTAVGVALLLQAGLISWLVYEHWRRQRAEAASLQQMHDLARMNRYATAGELSASIAHEIRQPLAAIATSGSAGLNWLKNKVPDLEEVRAALETVVQESHRADDVVKGVRAMFRNESAQRSAINLNELIAQVLALTARSMDSHNIVLQTSLTNDPPPIVSVDSVQIQQVILNLIMNAIEAISTSDRGNRLVRIETWIDDADAVVLTIADSGPGFDPKVANSLFTSFVTTKPNGMGMGLSICKSIVERHGGELTATSAAPRGAAFRVVFPTGEAK